MDFYVLQIFDQCRVFCSVYNRLMCQVKVQEWSVDWLKGMCSTVRRGDHMEGMVQSEVIKRLYKNVMDAVVQKDDPQWSRSANCVIESKGRKKD